MRERLLSPQQPVYVSAVTGYEIEFKANLGKLDWVGRVSAAVQTAGFEMLPIVMEHAELAMAGAAPLLITRENSEYRTCHRNDHRNHDCE